MSFTSFKFTCLLYISSIGFKFCYAFQNINSGQWEDPHDMFGGRLENMKAADPMRLSNAQNSHYFTKFLNKLLFKLDKSKWHSDNLNDICLAVHGNLKAIILRILKKTHADVDDLEFFDEAFGEAVNKAKINIDDGNIVSLWITLRNFFYFNQDTLFIVLILCIICGFFVFCYPKTTAFLIMIFISIFWNWIKLYQQKVAENQRHFENLRHPNECRRSQLTWYESIQLYFGTYVSHESDCQKYYDALLVNPIWEVSIPLAIVNGLTSVICEPVKVFATTIRLCIVALFFGVSNLHLSFIFIFSIIFFLFYYKYQMSVFWGMFSIKPSAEMLTDTPRSISYFGSFKNSLWGFLAPKNIDLIHPSPPPYHKTEGFELSRGIIKSESTSSKPLTFNLEQNMSRKTVNVDDKENVNFIFKAPQNGSFECQKILQNKHRKNKQKYNIVKKPLRRPMMCSMNAYQITKELFRQSKMDSVNGCKKTE